MYHEPVLINESIRGLNINPSGIYVDATFGGGGHSKAILKELDSKGKLIGIDQDKDAKNNVLNDSRFQFVFGNFKYLKNYLRYLEIDYVDGILADLGVSSHQFNVRERGFSYRIGGDIDMRMNINQNTNASDILNTYSESNLTKVFKSFSDIKNPKKLAKLIVAGRKEAPITKIETFQEVMSSAIPAYKENKYLAQVFQALRIEVNDEVGVLNSFLSSCADVLKPGGRLVVISYHSLEDRLIKNLIKTGNTEGITKTDIYGRQNLSYRAINRGVITPSETEVSVNSRAKSAKLRIAEKK